MADNQRPNWKSAQNPTLHLVNTQLYNPCLLYSFTLIIRSMTSWFGRKFPPTPIQKASVRSPFYEKKLYFFLKTCSKFFQVTAESHLQAIELEISYIFLILQINWQTDGLYLSYWANVSTGESLQKSQQYNKLHSPVLRNDGRTKWFID